MNPIPPHRTLAGFSISGMHPASATAVRPAATPERTPSAEARESTAANPLSGPVLAVIDPASGQVSCPVLVTGYPHDLGDDRD